ncbi:MAG: FlgD immunoglobulin-like domain containing protein [Candidatus Eisenbacteria bacterium]
MRAAMAFVRIGVLCFVASIAAMLPFSPPAHADPALLRAIAIVNTGSSFYTAYEDNQVWRWGGLPYHLTHIDRGDIAIRDMRRYSTLDAVVLFYDDEEVWAANTTQFWFLADAHRDGTRVLAFDASVAPQLVCTYEDGQVWIFTDGIWRREESLEREAPVPPPPSSSVIRIACYGWDSQPAECFDEAKSDTLFCFLPALEGPDFGGSIYHFGLISEDTDRICYIPGDTQPDSSCSYDLTAWFEPGSIVIGHVTGPGGNDQNAQIEGPEWQGHLPTDFTALRLELSEPGPCNMVRTLVVPIRWYSDAPAGIPVDPASLADRALAVEASPNPAHRDGGCVISFRVPSPGAVRITIHDIAGRTIRQLLDCRRPRGSESVTWDGRDDAGRPAPAGIYFARVQTSAGTVTTRVVLSE